MQNLKLEQTRLLLLQADKDLIKALDALYEIIKNKEIPANYGAVSSPGEDFRSRKVERIGSSRKRKIFF